MKRLKDPLPLKGYVINIYIKKEKLKKVRDSIIRSKKTFFLTITNSLEHFKPDTRLVTILPVRKIHG